MPALLGEYEVVRSIASGGMGAVFEVRSLRTGARYAAKKVLASAGGQARERFRREAELLARCDRHPGIVKVHAFGDAPDGSPCMILDLVEGGGGLDALVGKLGRVEPRRAAEIARDVASALAFVHERGIVHRDVKPSNILLDERGAPKLTDFGIATARDLDRLTKTGQFVGTLSYSPPEQVQTGAGEIGPWSDVWSLGAVLFHMLAGEAPIEGDTALEMMAALHDEAPVRDVRTLAPGVPAELAAVVACALEKSPGRRYPSGRELADDLARFLEGRPTTASDANADAGRRRRTRKLLAINLALVGVLGLTVGGALLLRRSRRDAALDDSSEALREAKRALAKLARGEPDARDVHALLGRARVRLADARGLGGGSDPARATELDGADAELATLEATRELARRAPAKALEKLDAVPGAPGSLGPEGRIVRARALAALGRADEAARDLAAVVPGLPAALRAEGAELQGDVLVAQGEFARAQASYSLALETRPRRANEVRAKRCGAAALAGDQRTAAADQAALLPDRELVNLAAERRDNERFAPLAPALYVRAIAASDPAAKGDLLDAALRLADEPASLRRDVARAWYAVAGGESQRLPAIFIKRTPASDDIELIRKTFVHYKRARDLDPTLDSQAGWTSFKALSLWVGKIDRSAAEPFLARLLTDWPDNPGLLYLQASVMRKASAEDARAALEIVRHAMRSYVAEVDDNFEARSLGANLMNILRIVAGFVRIDDDDEVLARRMAEKSATWNGWQELGQLLSLRREYERAWACVERGSSMPTIETGGPVSAGSLVEAQMVVLRQWNRNERALELCERAHAENVHDEVVTRVLCDVLFVLEKYGRILELVPDTDRVSELQLLQWVGDAQVELGLQDKAEKTARRLEELRDRDRAFRLRALIERRKR